MTEHTIILLDEGNNSNSINKICSDTLKQPYLYKSETRNHHYCSYQ